MLFAFVFDPVAVWAKHLAVCDGVKSALGFGNNVVCVAPRLIPSAPHALVAVVTNYGLGPSRAAFVAMLTIKNGVAFALVPRGMAIKARTRCVSIGASACLDWIRASKRIGRYLFFVPAGTEAKPVHVVVIGDAR
jgi:hypothetical protein